MAGKHMVTTMAYHKNYNTFKQKLVLKPLIPIYWVNIFPTSLSRGYKSTVLQPK